MSRYRRHLYLREMGYTLWRLRAPGEEPETEVKAASPRALRETESLAAPQGRKSIGESLSAVAATQGYSPEKAELPANLEISAPRQKERADTIARMEWPELLEAVRECRACNLCRRRTRAVPGVGGQKAEWLFIGEGPGEEEDRRGEPFVGQAGKLLDAMLAAIGLERGENVYIANVVKCRPEGNRTPTQEEIALCRPFLLRQIALIQPRLLVLLGKTAVTGVLGLEGSLASLRQKTLRFDDIPVVATYHPAYLLRTLPDKAKAWKDLCLARRVFRENAAKNSDATTGSARHDFSEKFFPGQER
ncbi:MAG: uracil-DNA glycosylase [Zoogloeaceae bacterium]|jgi:DNA polymerase|nr:uracil-DNA glycosylase [Zoogloeaceae bacterium]